MNPEICIYYDDREGSIIDIVPGGLNPAVRKRIEELWQAPIPRKILIELSRGATHLPEVQKAIGHSPSTLHEALQRLVDADLVVAEMSYKGHKHKVLSSRLLCVTKNPSFKTSLQRFFRGLWVDSEKTSRVVEAMRREPQRWWSAEELAAKTTIPVDEIVLLLSNFDSQTTRALSQFLKEPPFERQVRYRAK